METHEQSEVWRHFGRRGQGRLPRNSSRGGPTKVMSISGVGHDNDNAFAEKVPREVGKGLQDDKKEAPKEIFPEPLPGLSVPCRGGQISRPYQRKHELLRPGWKGLRR